MKKEKHAIVVGGGPAGMMASSVIAGAGVGVTLLEKNKRLGKKMLISGKGRCNVTNDSDIHTFLEQMPGNGKFLYSAYRNFSAAAVMDWFERRGVPLKTERGNRVFPASDRSSDIVGCMEKELNDAGAEIVFDQCVDDLLVKSDRVVGVEVAGRVRLADAVLIATGGLSYPLTGSIGDGYTFAENAGHHVTELFPSLVPLTVADPDVADLEGLSLRNVGVSLSLGEKKLESRFGEMVFTADGVSGPVILSLSRRASLHFLETKTPLTLSIDLKPALSEQQLDQRLLRDLKTNAKKNLDHIIEGLLPRKLVPVFIKRCGIDGGTKGSRLTREDRKIILDLLKSFRFSVVRCHRIEEAIVTGGGICVREIDPKTMMSKKVNGLFFAGEVLDIDGYTGGFNIQAALCSGHQAGKGMAAYCLRD